MTSGSDWFWWVVAALVAGLLGAYFLFTGAVMISSFRRLVETVQNWPQVRRAMVEAEARSGGRYPFWLRAARVTVVLSAIALVAYMVLRRIG